MLWPRWHPRPCAHILHRAANLYMHMQDMYTEIQCPFSLSFSLFFSFSVFFPLSLSRCCAFLLAAENIMMASERSCERSFVRSFVRLGLVLETGDKEGVSTAAIMIALSASPTPLHRSAPLSIAAAMHMHRVAFWLHGNVRLCTSACRDFICHIAGI